MTIRIFNIMRFAVHDGPGIRTAVFFKGCPLACWWCHNPESQSFEPELMYSAERCRLCGGCAEICPHHAILLCGDHVETNSACERCGACADFCAAEARVIAGRRVSVAALLTEIERDTIFFEDSGGGVTFTGGEPLAQPEGLEWLLRACRERGVHTAIETCGAAARETLLRLCGLANLVLYDLKLADAGRHRKYTGASNRNIVENLAALARVHSDVVVRVPIVPGVNDGEEEIAGLCGILRRLPIRRVELLPYHRAGTEKYRRLGRPYRLPDTDAPPAARITQVAGQMRAAGIAVKE